MDIRVLTHHVSCWMLLRISLLGLQPPPVTSFPGKLQIRTLPMFSPAMSWTKLGRCDALIQPPPATTSGLSVDVAS